MGGEKHEGEPDMGRKGNLCQVRISKTASRGKKFQLKTDFHKHLQASNPKKYSLVQSSSCNVTKHTTQSKHRTDFYRRASPRITVPQTRRRVISCRAKQCKHSVPLSSNIPHPQSNALRFTVSQKAATAGRGCVPIECQSVALIMNAVDWSRTCAFFFLQSKSRLFNLMVNERERKS